MANSTVYHPPVIEGLIIPEGFEVNDVHLVVLDNLLSMIIPGYDN